jgi:hypothetical protein
MLVAVDKLSVLCDECRNRRFAQSDNLQSCLNDLQEARNVLLSCADSEQAIHLFDTLVEQVKKTADCTDKKAPDTTVCEELSEMERRYLNFEALMKATCQPFKSAVGSS